MADLRRLLRSDRGLSAVEFGLAAPFIVLLLVGVTDLGVGFYDALQVQGASAAGAQYATVHAWSTTAITRAVQGASNLGTKITIPTGWPKRVCACPTDSGLTVSPDAPDTTTVTCTNGSVWSQRTTTCNGTKWGLYAWVKTQFTYSPMLPYPWTSDALTLTGEAFRRLL